MPFVELMVWELETNHISCPEEVATIARQIANETSSVNRTTKALRTVRIFRVAGAIGRPRRPLDNVTLAEDSACRLYAETRVVIRRGKNGQPIRSAIQSRDRQERSASKLDIASPCPSTT